MKKPFAFRPIIFLLFAGFCSLGFSQERQELSEKLDTTKPWTRWWWPGSAVNKENLTRQLEALAEAGIGGVEITPIYGARGYEDRYIDFLSDRWLEMLEHTGREAQRLGLGVDMATGTGWPFGGPWLTEADGNTRVVLQDGKLTGQPERQQVKRAAPGGEGLVANPYSRRSMDVYLERFSDAFKSFPVQLIRGQFHDSFEYYNASWEETLPERFYSKFGYDIQNYAAELLGEAEMDEESLGRLKSDYREMLSIMHMEYLEAWADWSHDRGFLTRNQSHGAPANLLDLYAIADIPETETFGSTPYPIPGLRRDDDAIRHDQDVPEPLVTRLASSAAHVMGKPLASSETCTWLRDHWKVTLGYAKPEIDRIFLDGINHIFYHGTVYSPSDVAWPGWLFYASTQFNPNNPWWEDFAALNQYVQRTQAVLQSGQPDNEVLLYWPIYDIWDEPDGLMQQLTVHHVDFVVGTPFGNTAKTLDESGYSFDYISDAQLLQTVERDGKLVTPGNEYAAILVPPTERMPVATLKQLIYLAESGATVVFQGLPEDVPGFGKLEERREALQKLNASASQWVASSWQARLQDAGVKREGFSNTPIDFIRRRSESGWEYFLSNLTNESFEGWVHLAVTARNFVLRDPLTDRSGIARIRPSDAAGTMIFLQMRPGESMLISARNDAPQEDQAWVYRGEETQVLPLDGPWRVAFERGGPELPETVELDRLRSWTEVGDARNEAFAGTARYTAEFEINSWAGVVWELDLGDIRDSARVWINGREVGVVWSLPFRTRVGPFLRDGKNRLEIEVTNVAANRIRDLDRRGVDWRIMREINFVDIRYRPFDATNWKVEPAGLLGPVVLRAFEEKTFQ